MRCFYRGMPSWNWYYPHHYAPMMSDMNDMDPSKGPIALYLTLLINRRSDVRLFSFVQNGKSSVDVISFDVCLAACFTQTCTSSIATPDYGSQISFGILLPK